MNGELVGSYRITGTLSVGGMGSIYTAEHTLIGRRAAVKMLLPELSQNREIVNRFFNEARATAAIRHPGIVEIFDFGYHASGHAYLVMELLDGEPLSARIARDGMLSEAIATGMIRSTIGALAAAHALGVVHRDLKPDNIFLVRDPDVPGGVRPKLLDFGIAKLADGAAGGNATRTGVVMGTPRYMSPEQCRGTGDVDARSDLYALGCIFYEMVTGRPPFVQLGTGELIAAHMMVEPEPPRAHNPALGEVIERVIVRLLAKVPADRYASASELLVALGGTPVDDAGRAVSLVAPAVLTPTPMHASNAQTPTTLSSAAGTAVPTTAPRRRRTKLVLELGGIAIGLGIVAVIALTGGEGPSPSVIPAAAPTPVPRVIAPPPPPPTIVVVPPAPTEPPATASDATAEAKPIPKPSPTPSARPIPKPTPKPTPTPSPSPSPKPRPKPSAPPDPTPNLPSLPPELD